MTDNERYEISLSGGLVIGVPVTLTPAERKDIIEKMFTINGWSYTILNEVSQSHFVIKLVNNNLGQEREYHLFHGNIRKEDPDRNREEKKIQLGGGNDPRDYIDNALILGFYTSVASPNLSDIVVVAWPVESNKNYPMNPSLRVNMRTDILPAKNNGFYVDKTTGKNLVAFRPEFIYHYLNNFKELQYSERSTFGGAAKGGYNKIFYGAPGCGKSYFIDSVVLNGVSHKFRTTFHPDYSNSDFVGQIMPFIENVPDSSDPSKIIEKITYRFNPGPFALALREAYKTDKMVFLDIEEINRGNASAIFGDIFQLLDRIDEPGDNLGKSRYSITNVALQKYLSDELGRPFASVEIPTNLTILATMNSSDQNVFTLDTAFKRRWGFEQMPNSFDSTHAYKDWKIPGTSVSWEKFVSVVNERILTIKVNNSTSEDKRLGKYFVGRDCLTEDETVITSCKEQANAFAYKVLEYLWNDVCKLNTDEMFAHGPRTLEELIKEFHKSTLKIFINSTEFYDDVI